MLKVDGPRLRLTEPLAVGDDYAGVVAFGREGGVAGKSAAAALDQDQVGDLRLARIVGAVKIAWSNLDALHPAGRDSAEIGIERFRLGARALAIDHDVSRNSGEAADVSPVDAVIGPEVERESGEPLDNVERCARRIDREEGRVIDGASAVLRRVPAAACQQFRESGPERALPRGAQRLPRRSAQMRASDCSPVLIDIRRYGR